MGSTIDQAGDEIKAKIVGKGRTNQDRIKKLRGGLETLLSAVGSVVDTAGGNLSEAREQAAKVLYYDRANHPRPW